MKTRKLLEFLRFFFIVNKIYGALLCCCFVERVKFLLKILSNFYNLFYKKTIFQEF